MIWYDTEALEELNSEYCSYFYTYGVVVGFRFTTWADYNGIYGLKLNTEYDMYCLLNNYYNQRWEAVGYVFE